MEDKRRAEERFDELEPALKDISRWMYEHPEVAFEEKETSARLVDFLEENGFVVEYPVFGLDTAFAARIGTSGPEVVICCEMDALPEVGHTCGHNIIAGAALGAGAALAARRRPGSASDGAGHPGRRDVRRQDRSHQGRGLLRSGGRDDAPPRRSAMSSTRSFWVSLTSMWSSSERSLTLPFDPRSA